MSIVTTDDLSAYLRRDLTGDMMAEGACDAANQAVIDFLDYDPTAVVDDEVVLSGDGSDALLLPALPVHNVSLVQVRPFRDDGDPITVDPSFYWLDQRKGVLYTRPYGAKWLRGHGAYSVTFTHGWGTAASSGSGDSVFPDIPRSIWRVALQVAARTFDQGLVKQETVGAVTTVYAAADPADLTKGERNVLAKYGLGR